MVLLLAAVVIAGVWSGVYVLAAVAWSTFLVSRVRRRTSLLSGGVAGLLPRENTEVRLWRHPDAQGAGSAWSWKTKVVLVSPAITALPDSHARAVVAHEHAHLSSLPLVEDIAAIVLLASIVYAVDLSGGAWWLFPLIVSGVMIAAAGWKALNRLSEYGADAWAVAHYDCAGELADALEVLTEGHDEPVGIWERWWGTHPPVQRRVARLRRWEHLSPPIQAQSLHPQAELEPVTQELRDQSEAAMGDLDADVSAPLPKEE